MASSKHTSKSASLAAFKIVARFMSGMSQKDLDDLASGAATLVLKRADEQPKQSDLPSLARESPDLDALRDALRATETTEAGFGLLDKAHLTRSELEKMVRSLDLPLLKQDSNRRLGEKIVEALIGSRLNSRAVRGR